MLLTTHYFAVDCWCHLRYLKLDFSVHGDEKQTDKYPGWLCSDIYDFLNCGIKRLIELLLGLPMMQVTSCSVSCLIGSETTCFCTVPCWIAVLEFYRRKATNETYGLTAYRDITLVIVHMENCAVHKVYFISVVLQFYQPVCSAVCSQCWIILTDVDGCSGVGVYRKPAMNWFVGGQRETCRGPTIDESYCYSTGNHSNIELALLYFLRLYPEWFLPFDLVLL